jgi:hypothetical protein
MKMMKTKNSIFSLFVKCFFYEHWEPDKFGAMLNRVDSEGQFYFLSDIMKKSQISMTGQENTGYG